MTTIMPTSLFIVPQKAHAQYPVYDAANYIKNLITANESTITALKTAISAIADVANQASLTALVIDKYVLEPLAFIMSGNLLKSLTSGIISFIDGNNGIGRPLFVQNLLGHLQSVGDTQAMAFYNQFLQNSNSPFASSIASSFLDNYLQQTNTGGFFAANQCTLDQTSPDINAYLSGDWSQGGIASWFNLTTQDANNPYIYQQNSQNELAKLVTDAQSAREQEIAWNQGFLSWCGTATPPAQGALGSVAVTTDYCTNSDGTPGTIQTPGSLIKSELEKALGSSVDKLVAMGNISPEINAILGDVGNIINTVNFATQLLGAGNSGGLAGLIAPSSSGGPSLLSQYQNSGYFTGGGQSTVYQTAGTLPIAGADMLTRITQYQTAWNTIGNSANTASSSLRTLINYCTTQADAARNLSGGTASARSNFIAKANALISSAQNAIANEVGPVLAQKSQADQVIAAAQAALQQLQTNTSDTYTADLQALQTMPPTATDVVTAEHDAQATSGASASPNGSLTVAGGTLVDQMTLLSGNATSLQSSCNLPASFSNSNSTFQL